MYIIIVGTLVGISKMKKGKPSVNFKVSEKWKTFLKDCSTSIHGHKKDFPSIQWALNDLDLGQRYDATGIFVEKSGKLRKWPWFRGFSL